MTIRRLDWDSSFFGYEIGRLDVAGNDLDMVQLAKLAAPYKLVYIFSENELVGKDLFAVDQKVLLHQEITEELQKETNPSVLSFNKERDSYQELQELAIASGKYSRFNVDKKFQNKEFEKLYLRWLEKSVEDRESIDVKIYKEEKEILGFVSIDEHDTETAEIGLVAVNQKARGKGVATALMEASLQAVSTLGYKIIEVTTQLQNKPAMKLYKKCNFEVKQITHIYHYWNK